MAIRHDVAGSERDYLLDMLAEGLGAVLEIGCGEGRVTRKYAGLAQRVAAIDLPGSISRDGKPPLQGSVTVAAASGLALPFGAGCFDQAIFALSF